MIKSLSWYVMLLVNNWEILSNLCGLLRKLWYNNAPSQRISTICSRLDLVFDWHCSRRENNLVNPKMAKMPRRIYCAVYRHSHFLRNFWKHAFKDLKNVSQQVLNRSLAGFYLAPYKDAKSCQLILNWFLSIFLQNWYRFCWSTMHYDQL